MSGQVSRARVLAQTKQGTTIPLNLEPYASRVLVFSRRSLPTLAPSMIARRVPVTSATVDLSSGWEISFGQGEDGKSKTMDRLESWTEDKETRYFSGLATYEKDFTVPEDMFQAGLEVQ